MARGQLKVQMGIIKGVETYKHNNGSPKLGQQTKSIQRKLELNALVG